MRVQPPVDRRPWWSCVVHCTPIVELDYKPQRVLCGIKRPGSVMTGRHGYCGSGNVCAQEKVDLAGLP